MASIRTLAGITLLLLFLWVAPGCYETKYPLAPAANAVVVTSYVGDFAFTDKDETDQIVIRNIDGHQYYVEFSKKGGDTLRMVGYTSDVNGVMIANLRAMEADGAIQDQYLLMRMSFSPDHTRLSILNLNDKFFANKNIDSSDAQRKVIAANLGNDQMYDGNTITFTRVVPASQTKPANPNGM